MADGRSAAAGRYRLGWGFMWLLYRAACNLAAKDTNTHVSILVSSS